MIAPLAPNDYEQRTLDVVKRLLDDIHDCNVADYRIRWVEGIPHLVIAFVERAQGNAIPAFGIRLATSPSNALVEGDRLRRLVRNGLEQYLAKHGVKVTLVVPHTAN